MARRRNKNKRGRGGAVSIERTESREETGLYFETEPVVYWDVVGADGQTLMRFTDYAPFSMKVELGSDRNVWVTAGGTRTSYPIEQRFDPDDHYAHGARAEDWNRKR